MHCSIFGARRGQKTLLTDLCSWTFQAGCFFNELRLLVTWNLSKPSRTNVSPSQPRASCRAVFHYCLVCNVWSACSCTLLASASPTLSHLAWQRPPVVNIFALPMHALFPSCCAPAGVHVAWVVHMGTGCVLCWHVLAFSCVRLRSNWIGGTVCNCFICAQVFCAVSATSLT